MKYELSRNIPLALRHYMLSVFSVAAAAVIARQINGFIPGLFAFPFLAAILVTARWASKRSTILAVVLSAAAISYFFLPPVNSFAVAPSAFPFFGCFLGCAMTLSFLMTESGQGAFDVYERPLRQSFDLGKKVWEQSGHRRAAARSSSKAAIGPNSRLDFLAIGLVVFIISALYCAPVALYYRNWSGGLLFAVLVTSIITYLVARKWR